VSCAENGKMSVASAGCCNSYGLVVGWLLFQQWQMMQRPHRSR